jgi:hypothetical protein
VNNSEPSGVGLVMDPALSSLISELLIFLNYYAEGDFRSIKKYLTSDKYIALVGSLGRLIITDPNVSVLRTSALSSLQGLQRAHVQYTQLVDATASYKVVKERAAILDDVDLLKAFLLALNARSNASILGEYKIESSISAAIPPAYLLYIQLFGFPQDGVFDVNKLAGVT